MFFEFVKSKEIIIVSKLSWLNLSWMTDIFKFFIIIIIFIFCAFFWIFWAFWIFEICFIFIEFYLFIVLFFIIIICLFTSHFFRCIIILIAVRKNDIHLIQIKYCLSHFQFFFNICLNDVSISKFFAIEAFNFCSIFHMLFEVFWTWNLEWSVNKWLSDFVTYFILYFLTALVISNCMLK